MLGEISGGGGFPNGRRRERESETFDGYLLSPGNGGGAVVSVVVVFCDVVSWLVCNFKSSAHSDISNWVGKPFLMAGWHVAWHPILQEVIGGGVSVIHSRLAIRFSKECCHNLIVTSKQ